MGRSFKSFEEIYAAQKRIDEVLVNHQRYYAHTHPHEPFETLQEHVELVIEYALRLVEQHGLDGPVDSLVAELVKEVASIEHPEEVGNYLKELFLRVLIFHDYGKVNENFQIKKMKAVDSFVPNESNQIDSQHSILSAFIFLAEHLEELKNDVFFTNEERNLLTLATYLFSTPVIKHHAPFLQTRFEYEESLVDALDPYLQLFNSQVSPRGKQMIVKAKDYIESLRGEKYLALSSNAYLQFFLLLKLNFSLLTASDYYATNEFMQGMEIKDFGLIDPEFKSRLFQNFIQNPHTPYNGDLIQNLSKYLEVSFKSLQERNNKNLNLLRQKMAAEAVTTLRENLEQRLFYLEAPTGGGKTNMSFACALELIKADSRLNKVFYVFPFTTLITQTFGSIKKTLQISDLEVIQLHAKSGFHTPVREDAEDGLYGQNRLNFVQNHFINYPFTLLSHVRFFDILKGNHKEANYILHRLSNAVVIIDELQTYDPKHWDKIMLFLHEYAKHFNIRFIIMSATLPKIDQLIKEASGKVIRLIPNKDQFFQNPNFKERIQFDFSLLGRSGKEKIDLEVLINTVFSELENYAEGNKGQVKGLIEFIIKKSASSFFQLIAQDQRFDSYKKFLISGTILEPRRREVIDAIKNDASPKMLVITTQVIEAGVDIDMDIGFKDTSIVDSDEQLAGRVNRNAKKDACKVFIFNYDREIKIYGKDKRYKQRLSQNEYESILRNKDFDLLYNRVNKGINRQNESTIDENLDDYLGHFSRFDFRAIHENFKLIDQKTCSVFVPLGISIRFFSDDERSIVKNLKLEQAGIIHGHIVFDIYKAIILGDGDFIEKEIKRKQIAGIMSKFMFSVYADSKLEQHLMQYSDPVIYERFGLIYLDNYKNIYSFKGGINNEIIDSDFII